ncbi:MAG TPA: hypothetical protein VMF91_13050 [Bryobacteraceae bacterium]|nr:hypothetical protein [Bryobacteraceae bacterium]
MKRRVLSIASRLATEIAIVGVISVLVIFILQKLRQPAPSPGVVSMQGEPVAIGSPIAIKSVEFGGRPLTLLLVSSPYCHFCVESKNFHKRLIAEAQSHHVPFYVSVPEISSSATYVKDFRLRSGQLKGWRDLSGSVQGTPTLVGIDSSGHVARLWVGELQPAGENDVLEVVRSGDLSQAVSTAVQRDVREFSPETVNRLRGTQKLDIIDVRERSEVRHLSPGVANIPLQEVPYRIAYDIAPDVLHVIDCRTLPLDVCGQAVQVFRQEGLRVATMGKGTYQASWCRATLLDQRQAVRN